MTQIYSSCHIQKLSGSCPDRQVSAAADPKAGPPSLPQTLLKGYQRAHLRGHQRGTALVQIAQSDPTPLGGLGLGRSMGCAWTNKTHGVVHWGAWGEVSCPLPLSAALWGDVVLSEGLTGAGAFFLKMVIHGATGR